MSQQIVSYEELFDHIKDNGVYLCEDTHTSYWLAYGGGYKRRGTFIEYTKNFIDYLNAYHSEQKRLAVNDFTKSVDSIHYYDSIVVIEKREREAPYHKKTGNISFLRADKKETGIFKAVIVSMINKVLRFFRLKSIVWK
jgi:hypothetical protein